jgi:hypothetical protein
MLIDKLLKYLRKTGLDPSHNYDFPFFRFDKATDEELSKMYSQQMHGTESDRPAPRNWELPQGNPCRDWHMPFDNMLVELGAQPQKFMDQKILKGLSRVFSCGGTIHIESDDGYKGTITLPGPAEEEE